MPKIPKDTRNAWWGELEKTIQTRAPKKDKKFILTGKWKKFLRTQNGYKIYAVDGSWIRSNLCVYYGHGGHFFVHEFIPKGEIWVSTHHYDEGASDLLKCNCVVKKKNQKVSKNYFESTLIHEMEECEQMKKGKNYWEAHTIALAKELEVGFLEDPFKDI